jgi:starvation-inducible DNA-binding protein
MTPLHPDAELPAGAISRKKQDELQSSADVATASLLENWIDESEKRIWFLFECGRRL